MGRTKGKEISLASQDIILKDGKEWSVVFNNISLPDKPILKITISPDDEMMCDNTTWLLPAENTVSIIIVGQKSLAMAKALESIRSAPAIYAQNARPSWRLMNSLFIYI